MASRTVGSLEAGPSVATILVACCGMDFPKNKLALSHAHDDQWFQKIWECVNISQVWFAKIVTHTWSPSSAG
jgi:hypothetical protein